MSTIRRHHRYHHNSQAVFISHITPGLLASTGPTKTFPNGRMSRMADRHESVAEVLFKYLVDDGCGVENGTIKSTMSWITDIWDARIVLFGRNRWMKVLWKYRKRKTKTASSAYVACVFVYSCVSSPSACSASSLRSETCVNLCYYFIIYLRARNVCCTFLMFELCHVIPVPTNQFSHRTAEQQRYVNESITVRTWQTMILSDNIDTLHKHLESYVWRRSFNSVQNFSNFPLYSFRQIYWFIINTREPEFIRNVGKKLYVIRRCCRCIP